MKVLWRNRIIIFLIVILILIVGCGGPSEPVLPPSDPPPPSTDTPIPPTEKPEPISLVFDGTECTLSGPTEIPAGEHPIFVDNQAEYELNLFVRRLLDGKTNQDFLDLQSESGFFFTIPNWVKNSLYQFSPELKTQVHFLDEAGEYVVSLERGFEPKHIWICPPIRVVD